MTNNLIERIIEVEKKANGIIGTAQIDEKDVGDAVANRKKEFAKRYEQLLSDTVQKAKDEAMEENKAEIEKLGKEIESKKKELKEKYDSNFEKWVNDLFEEILR